MLETFQHDGATVGEVLDNCRLFILELGKHFCPILVPATNHKPDFFGRLASAIFDHSDGFDYYFCGFRNLQKKSNEQSALSKM